MVTLQQLKNILANRVQRLRKRSYLTIEKLAEEAHISKGTINQLESGQSNVTLEKLYRVCKHFNIPMSQLLDEPAGVPEIKDLRDVNRQIEAIYACLDHIQKYIHDRLDELDQ